MAGENKAVVVEFGGINEQNVEQVRNLISLQIRRLAAPVII